MKKILVIDDEPVIVELVKNRLEKNKYEVYTATDGVEGLVKAKDLKPDLIVLDIMMPNLDGYSFVQEIKYKEELRNIPILVFTAKSDLQDLFKTEGIVNYMVKPFKADDFLKQVRELVGE